MNQIDNDSLYLQIIEYAVNNVDISLNMKQHIFVRYHRKLNQYYYIVIQYHLVLHLVLTFSY